MTSTLSTFLCLAILLLAATPSHAASECTSTSSLRQKLGIDNSVTTPTAAAGVNYCKSIKSGNLCCTAAAINGFQAKSDLLVTNLTNAVASRDKYYVSVRDIGASGLDKAYDTVKSGGIAPSSTLTIFAAQITALKTQLSAINTTLPAFQKSRTTCVTQLLKMQNALQCLACDPDASSKGYVNGALTVNPNLCQRLTTACYDYLANSNLQNAAFSANRVVSSLSSYAVPTINIDLSNPQAAAEALKNQAAQLQAQMEAQKTAINYPVGSLPSGCTAASCPYICQTLFSVNGVSTQNLLIGGETNIYGSRLLQSSSSSSGFNPDDDEAGVTVAFTDDPGNANAKSGMMTYGSVMVGVAAVMSALML